MTIPTFFLDGKLGFLLLRSGGVEDGGINGRRGRGAGREGGGVVNPMGDPLGSVL